MDTLTHTMNNLFEQLGLPCRDRDIEAFVHRHKPLAEGVALADAVIWSDNQAEFIREAIDLDSDWAEVVDQLDARLRQFQTSH
ncbi:MAG: DUF2789 domain-containing protein [Exilibacterium sp.]